MTSAASAKASFRLPRSLRYIAAGVSLIITGLNVASLIFSSTAEHDLAKNDYDRAIAERVKQDTAHSTRAGGKAEVATAE